MSLNHINTPTTTRKRQCSYSKIVSTTTLIIIHILTNCLTAAAEVRTVAQWRSHVTQLEQCTIPHDTLTDNDSITTLSTYRGTNSVTGNAGRDLLSKCEGLLKSDGFSISTASQKTGKDSLTTRKETPVEKRIDKLASSRIYQTTYAAGPLIVLGMVAKNKDKHFRKLRNDYMKGYRITYDDYIQYLPAFALMGMKTAGVESRSSWGRMLASDGFSAAIMAGAVNIIKHTANVTRPDGSDNNSFPSGHTATAFMTATMFSKEYGGRYPWLSAGAYGVATATGLYRMANNKHWLSDVLTGAGIGILSTEVGYYIADLIFKGKGLNANNEFDQPLDKTRKPSFLGLYMGMNIPLSDYDVDEAKKIKTSSCSTSGIEGAWFFSPYVGIGGRLTISDISLYSDVDDIENDSFRFSSLCGGAYFSYPLSTRFAIGSKLLAGYNEYGSLKINNEKISKKGGFCAGTGLSMTFQARTHLCFKIFGDYNIIPPHSNKSNEHMHTISTGAMVALTF